MILSSTLDWTAQVNDVCLKANRKLSVLRSVKLLNRETLDSKIRSGLCLTSILQNLKITDLARLKNVQYRAGKIVTGTFHYTKTEKLNIELGWEKIAESGNILSLSLFHKIHLHETRPLIKTCLT